MRKKYLLGVDGGNTKTLYFLHELSGKYVDHVAAGTCSHEALPDSYRGTERELRTRLHELFSRNGVHVEEVEFAVFGLAGADFAHQKRELSAIIARLGFRRFLVENDGYLGLKAGSPSGCGICNINGTGTVTVGINAAGGRLQVGGLGGMSSDKGGAGYIAERGVAAVYDAIYRCGRPTRLKNAFFHEFRVTDEAAFPACAASVLKRKDGVLKVNRIMEEAERQGDECTAAILTEIGQSLAQSVTGCAEKLGMQGDVPVVLAGSVWAKGRFQAMWRAFHEKLAEHKTCLFSCVKLRQAPVAGAVLWALEEAQKKQPDIPIAYSRKEFLALEAFADVVY